MGRDPTPLKPKLPAIQRRSVSLSPETWVIADAEQGQASNPRIFRPAIAGVYLLSWVVSRRAFIEDQLAQAGAVLFRGFGLRSPQHFDTLVATLTPGALPYVERSSPRSQVEGHVYTSTDHPPDHEIFLHNEQSYNLVFPGHISFFCAEAAARGGATPIADTRRIYQRIDPAIRERFERQGYLYSRSFGGRIGISWQTAFQTASREEVNSYCRDSNIEATWLSDDCLRTRQLRRAVARHPRTGEPCWFNHATFFHVSTLPREVASALLSQLGEDELPNNTYYGDGSPIEAEVMDALRSAYQAELTRFSWQDGDVLMLDNLLMAHGRDPFVGSRSVMVAMSTPRRWDDV